MEGSYPGLINQLIKGTIRVISGDLRFKKVPSPILSLMISQRFKGDFTFLMGCHLK